MITINEGPQKMASVSLLADVETLRSRARAHTGDGAVTISYSADRTAVLMLLNESLATELVCVLRYRRHHFMARGIQSRGVAQEFLEHSNEELTHADRIASRIVQLGGEPNFSPHELVERSHAEYIEADTLAGMIRENLVAERIAIDSYRDFIRYLGSDDSTTRCMLEEILAVEEQHAAELSDLLDTFPIDIPTIGSANGAQTNL